MEMPSPDSSWGGALAAFACTSPVADDSRQFDVLVSPSCQTGCQEQDPNPSAPGVFLGSLVTPTMCGPENPNGISDADYDDLSNYCETNLALAFAPELAYSSYDYGVGREPHWLSMPSPNNSNDVRILYLLSYYDDWGVQNIPPCLDFLPSDWCFGHAGDSEAIGLDVHYNTGTQHWVLLEAWYSAHDAYNYYGPGANGYPTALYYPSHAGAYPRSYVSINKHANYSNPRDCDAAQYGFEDCHSDQYARVDAGGSLNIGSNDMRLLDCMASANPLYHDNGVIECYWTGSQFSGWQGWQPAATRYYGRFVYFGFAPPDWP